MKNSRFNQSLIFLALLLFTGLWSCQTTEEKTIAEWANPEVFAVNKEDPRAHFVHYPSLSEALAGEQTSSWYQSLNGTWKFNWVRKPADRPMNFYENDYDVSGWDDIQVPATGNYRATVSPFIPM